MLALDGDFDFYLNTKYAEKRKRKTTDLPRWFANG